MRVPGTLGGLATLLLLCLVTCFSQAVILKEKMANVYDIAPKVRIAGEQFDSIDVNALELSFAPKLLANQDYTVSVQSPTVMVLSLLPGKKWVKMEAGSSPTPLYLTLVKVGGNVLSADSIQIATVVPSPTVEACTREIYMKTTPKLVLNGTNFNIKNTELFFDPPLEEGSKIQKQVLSSTQISIVKLHNDASPHQWAEEPGPLKVRAIDTGAGRLALSPEDGGVVIAEVQADLDGHGVSVTSHESLDIYQSTKELKITGEGFLPDCKVRFANALRGRGTNFTITNFAPTELTVTLVEGSTWRRNPASLPGALVLLAVDAGAGWVPVGPTTAKAGRQVATVFEDPSVDTSHKEIYRTHTHELVVTGTGFTNKKMTPALSFDPPLDVSNTFVAVVNRTTLRLTLSSITSEWTPEDRTGPLSITGMDTGAGLITFDAPVVVATVVPDTSAHESGVQVFPSYGQPVYQSSQESIHIMGTGFKGDPILNFVPPLWSTSNYTLEVVNENELKLTLVEGSRWSLFPGALLAKGINVGDGDVQLAGGNGVKVATILQDPYVTKSESQIYASHTKHFPVHGSGFVSVQDPLKPPTILLDGIPSTTYTIQNNWHNGIFNLQLIADKWVELTDGQTRLIKLMSINTGAGEVVFPGGVEIAEVREDSDTALCEDSCTYANDGQCDEPTVAQGSPSSAYYNSYYSDMMSYQPYGWGADDDANGLASSNNDYSGMYRYAGYSTTYHNYGIDDNTHNTGLAPCSLGTDCSDCGVKFVPEGSCTNICEHSRDGICDDPRLGGYCPAGTDCQDCGPWGDAGTNFTFTSFYASRSWYNDDDDWIMLEDDDAILEGQGWNAQAPYKRNYNDHNVIHKEAAGAGTIFVDVLWAMVVLVGCSVSVGGCMLAYKHVRAGGAPMYLSVQPTDEVELSRRGNGEDPTERTPDVVRIG